ncbi:MAG: glycosyl hydrolase family 18 protein [Aestuariibacter sp.]
MAFRSNVMCQSLATSCFLMSSMLCAETLQSEVAVVGEEGQWWNNYTISLTNISSDAIDLDNATIDFSSAVTTSTPNWSGTDISYPSLTSSSTESSGSFYNTLLIEFDDNSWTDAYLEPGNSVTLSYGVNGQIDIDLVRDSLIITTDNDNPPALSVSFSSPANNAEYQEGDTVPLTATVSAQNTTVQQVDFYVDQQLLASDTQAPFSTNWNATTVGTVELSVIALDGNSLSVNDNVVIQVLQNQPEATIAITIDSPTDNDSVTAGSNVAIAASVTASNTSADRVEFKIDGQLIATDSVAPFTANWNASGTGERQISATVFDTSGSLSDSSAATITVTPETNPTAPEVELDPGVSSIFVNQTLSLQASVSDVNDDIVGVEYFADSVSIGNSTQPPYDVNWQPTQAGTVQLSAVATDATGLTGQSENVAVQVNETGNGNLSCDIKQVYRADGTECMGDDHPRRIIGYFTSWRTGKNGLPAYLVKDLPWDRLTHINYAFASINTQTNEIQVSAEATDLEWPEIPGAEMDPAYSYKGHFNHLSSFKQHYPDVKTLISVGGWAETTGFYSMTTDLNTCGVNQAGINAFNASAVAFIRQYGFDGVDVDYEYPSSMADSGNPIDFEISNKCRGQLMDNYQVFMTALRAELDTAGQQDNRKYMLTIAAPSSGYLLRGMEDFALGGELDYVNIMTYDLHGAWNEYVGPQAALFDNGDDAELAAAGVYTTSQYQQIGYLNTAWAYQYFRGVFAPAQINIGIPYYTRGFQGVSGGVNGLWGSAVLPDQTKCLPGTGANTPCGYGAEGIDNLWHDLDDEGNEIPAGSMPMWHAMNLRYADSLNFGDMPSYGPDWGLDSNNPADKIVGNYEYHYSQALGASWLWNPDKQVFLSIEDESSLAQKLDFIVEMGAGGMMVWEMAGDYGFDADSGEYTFGTTLTDLAYNTFANASAMNITHNDLPPPEEVIDLSVSTRDWPIGDNNYPVNPTLVLTNNSSTDIPAGSEITFLMTTSTGDNVSDWDGAGIAVTQSGNTGNNFKLNGTRADFHTVRLPLSSSAPVAAGEEFTVSMVYYLPVSGIISGLRINLADRVLGLKSEFPHLPEYDGNGSGGGNGGTGSDCASMNINPSDYPAYPDFPNQDWQGNPSHAVQGDRMTHQNTVWEANWWTTATPGSDGSWTAICTY